MNFEKKLKESRSVRERKSLLDPSDKLSLRKQADLLEVDRSSLYYKPIEESEENMTLMRHIDELFLGDPTLGLLGMQDELRIWVWFTTRSEYGGCKRPKVCVLAD